MTPEQIALVQESFKKVVPIKDAAAGMFYDRLFTLDPSLIPLFKGDMAEQGRKLMAMLGTAVTGLTKLESIVPALEALGQRHGEYGVQSSHYGTVAEALLWTLEQGLGDAFTDDVREAWVAAYGILSSTMIAAAEKKPA